MKTLLNFYFRFPVKVDYCLIFILVFILNKYFFNCSYHLPDNQSILEMASETITILLTLSGFILTFLTVLITFKLDVRKIDEEDYDKMSPIEKFCTTDLFFETTSHLKNAVKSIVFTSLTIYIIRVLSLDIGMVILYLSTIGGIVILILTILRSLFILDKILDLQKKDKRT
jgi:hypothetical protein